MAVPFTYRNRAGRSHFNGMILCDVNENPAPVSTSTNQPILLPRGAGPARVIGKSPLAKRRRLHLA
jgi:hypothetical protein